MAILSILKTRPISSQCHFYQPEFAKADDVWHIRHRSASMIVNVSCVDAFDRQRRRRIHRLCRSARHNCTRLYVLKIDALTDAGDLARLAYISAHPRYAFEKPDVAEEPERPFANG